MEAAPILAKGPAGQYFIDLMKACEDHFSRMYSECVNSTDHETVMCPPVFPFGYVAPTGQASGAIPLTDIEKDTINGDKAELKIFHVLEKFGEETKQPMFVLTQLKMSEFIKDVLRQKLPADHPILRRNLEGEIDFAIIHRKIGVILMEVKAAEKFSKSLQSKARKQLQIGEEIIHALLDADHKPEISLPVYKVIAMPNVSRGNQNFVNLRQTNVHSNNNFISWWKMNFPEKEFVCQEQRAMQNLISIFVGQKSQVSSKVFSDVFKKIDNQNFLRKSYEKSAKEAVDGSHIVQKTSEHANQAPLAKQFLFLNPDQLRIWNGPLHMFFNGSSGSGKTILLQFKALECARKGENVVIVVPSSLIALYRDLFSQNSISGELVDVLSPTEFFQVHGKHPGSDVTEKFHFFADELQTFQTEIPDVLTLLEKLMTRLTEFDCYCWIAYDYMQRNEDEISQDETGGLSGGAKLQTLARKLCKSYNFFHAPCLKTVVRSTFEIYSYVQAFVKTSLQELLQRLMLFKHIEKETKEMWVNFVARYDVSNHLGHHVCGPSVAVFRDSDLENITGIIQMEVKKWTNGDSMSLHHVAVLVTSPFLKERLSHLMAVEEIPICDVGSQENAVVLDFGHKALSYEWPVVITVSWSDDVKFSSGYIMFTRAVSRLVVMTSRK